MEKSKGTVPVITGEVSDELTMISKLLDIYSVVKGKRLKPAEKTLLMMYIKYGYSLDIRDMVAQDLKKTIGNIKVMETSLRKEGFLNKGENNQRKSELSKDMESLREQFLRGGKRFLGVYLKWDK